MNMEEIQAHLQKANGIEPGTIYDPELHDDVPALCFGDLLPEITDLGGDILSAGSTRSLLDGWDEEVTEKGFPQ